MPRATCSRCLGQRWPCSVTTTGTKRPSGSVVRNHVLMLLRPPHVFASEVGTPLHPSNVARAWRAVLERAHVPHLTQDGRPRGLHELRRTFATRLRDRGIPLEDVQRLGRWSSPAMLLQVYSASGEDRLGRRPMRRGMRSAADCHT